MSRSQDTVWHKKAIRRSIENTIAAFNARKASPVLQEYAQDLDVVTTRGEHLRERDEVKDRLEGLFSRPDFALQQRLDPTIRFVRDDVALVHVEIEMSGAVLGKRRAAATTSRAEPAGLCPGGGHLGGHCLPQYCCCSVVNCFAMRSAGKWTPSPKKLEFLPRDETLRTDRMPPRIATTDIRTR